MKKIYAALLLLSTAACGEKRTADSNPDPNKAFGRYKEQFVEALWKLYPNWASSAGYHKYDSILSVPDPSHRESELAFVKAHLDSLARYRGDSLDDLNRTDLLMMADFLRASEWGLTRFRAYEWIPSHYNVCEGFAEILNNNYDSLDNRLRNFSLRLRNVPAYYKTAIATLKNPTREHTDLAISQNLGGLSVFEADLDSALKRSTLTEPEKKTIRERAGTAVASIRSYAEWLRDSKFTFRDFRLGKKLYQEKFAHDLQSAHNADEVYARALARKKMLRSRMMEITRQLWPKYLSSHKMPADSLRAIRMLIDHLSVRHAKPDSFQAAIERQIPQLADFVNRKNLLYLDPSKPLVVRKEPAYMAGVAGASINSPGPYDKKGNTYYNVGSMSGWTKERAESYLREYNYWILQILNIHEAIPGHYTQLVYSNKSPSLIKAILGNGTMVEGWAVYTELMMLENGYGAPEGQETAEPEMWLMYYKWNLRSVCNTILDYGVHVNDISREDAIALLMNEAFQQQAEAEGKWKRATLSQVQLCSYFTGFMEIMDLREEIKNKQGDKFDLKAFHEKFLSYGSAPVKYIREMMLRDLGVDSRIGT